jgi:hypothetical protein
MEERRPLVLAWASRIEVGRAGVKFAIANASDVDVNTARARIAASDIVQARDDAIKSPFPPGPKPGAARR